MFGNSVWTRKDFFDLLENESLEILDSNYLAQFKFFGSGDPTIKINEWVNRTTRGRIGKIVGEFFKSKETLLIEIILLTLIELEIKIFFD